MIKQILIMVQTANKSHIKSRKTLFSQELKLHIISFAIMKNKNMNVVFHFVHEQ